MDGNLDLGFDSALVLESDGGGGEARRNARREEEEEEVFRSDADLDLESGACSEAFKGSV